MITYDRALSTVSSNQSNPNIDPSMAFWHNSSSTWVVAGRDVAGGAAPNSARWGRYNPANGLEVMVESSAGSFNIATGAYVTQSYIVNSLPGDAIHDL